MESHVTVILVEKTMAMLPWLTNGQFPGNDEQCTAHQTAGMADTLNAARVTT